MSIAKEAAATTKPVSLWGIRLPLGDVMFVMIGAAIGAVVGGAVYGMATTLGAVFGMLIGSTVTRVLARKK